MQKAWFVLATLMLALEARAGTEVAGHGPTMHGAMDEVFQVADRRARLRGTCLSSFPTPAACTEIAPHHWECKAVVADHRGSCEPWTDERVYQTFLRPPGQGS